MKTLVANPKRRWILAIVAIVVVAGVMAFLVLREDPKDDLPRLVVLRQEQVNGQEVVVFRFDAPKHRRAGLQRVETENPSTGRQPVRPSVPWLVVEAGPSTEIRIIPPVDDVWRLRCSVALEATVTKDIGRRLRMCWREKSFGPLRPGLFYPLLGKGALESDFITNAVPADALRP